jgi:hypothetical protein
MVECAGYWMHQSVDAWHASHMPNIDLAPDELQDAAQAARVAAVQAEKDAERQSNLSIRAMFDNTARRFRELAARFERARINGRE